VIGLTSPPTIATRTTATWSAPARSAALARRRPSTSTTAAAATQLAPPAGPSVSRATTPRIDWLLKSPVAPIRPVSNSAPVQ